MPTWVKVLELVLLVMAAVWAGFVADGYRESPHGGIAWILTGWAVLYLIFKVVLFFAV